MSPVTNDEYMERLYACSRCGKCRAVCPVFGLTLDEKHVARGRLAVIRAWAGGEISAASEAQYRTLLDLCAGCRKCEKACPGKLPVFDLLQEARFRMAGKRNSAENLPDGKDVFGELMLAGLFDPEYGLDRELVGGTPPEIVDLGVTRRFGVEKGGGSLLFVGEALNYHLHDAALNVFKLAQKAGLDIVVRRDQAPSGLLAAWAGLRDVAHAQLEANARLFAEYDSVLTIDPADHFMLTVYAETFGLATNFADKIKDAMTVIVERTGADVFPGAGETFYHLSAGEAKMPVWAERAGFCRTGELFDGAHGLFPSLAPELASRLGRLCLDDIVKRAKAGPIRVACTGGNSVLHLRRIARDMPGDLRVEHVGELIR